MLYIILRYFFLILYIACGIATVIKFRRSVTSILGVSAFVLLLIGNPYAGPILGLHLYDSFLWGFYGVLPATIFDFAGLGCLLAAIIYAPLGVRITEKPAMEIEYKLRTVDLKMFPKIWIGYIIAAVLAIASIVDIFTQSGYGMRQQTWSLIFRVLVIIYYCICVYKLHKIIAIATDNRHPITPVKAVGFHFIPFFNFYWFVKWPNEIANFVNAQKPEKPMLKGLGGIVILISIILSLLPISTGNYVLFSGGLAGPFIYFYFLDYVVKRVKTYIPHFR